MASKKFDDLQELMGVHGDVLQLVVAHVRASLALHAALIAHLGEGVDRAAIREAAFIVLGDGPENEAAASLIELMTQEPTAAVVDRQTDVSTALADAPARLQ